MKGLTNVLDEYIPKDEFMLVQESHPVYFYEHKTTGLPLACVAGGHQGHIIGGVFYFRAEDDSMNMEIEAPMETMHMTTSFMGTLISKTQIPKDGVEGVRKRFIANLNQHLSGKRWFGEPSEPQIIIDQQDAEAPGVAEEAEPPTECMICLEKAPDTTVTPCLHQVVCAACSVALEKTPDAKICCQCRCKIDGIFYPDNTVKEIK